MNTANCRTVELKFNAVNQPIMQAPNKGRLVLEVCDATKKDEMKHVTISGSPEALHALGVILLGISETPDYHIHIDEEANGAWFKCQQGFTLTLGNNAKPKRHESRTPNEPPPDWARG